MLTYFMADCKHRIMCDVMNIRGGCKIAPSVLICSGVSVVALHRSDEYQSSRKPKER